MKKILFLLICFYASHIFASTGLQFETRKLTLQNSHPKYTIQVSYPTIYHPTNIAEKKFNVLAKTWVFDTIKDFKKSITENESSTLPADIKANGSTLNINYEVTTLDPQEFVSLRFSADSYLVGSAHGSHKYTSINYDLIHNEPVLLANLFTANSNYLTRLSQIASKKISDKLHQESNGQTVTLFKEGLAPTPKNYEVWNVTPKGLRLTFNEYQVAAYVFGPQEITIPYQTIKPYLNSHSVLGNCVMGNDCILHTYAPSSK